MRDFTKRLFACMLALFVVTTGGLALTGGVAAETDTLNGDGSDTVPGFNASEDDHLKYTLSADGTDFASDNTSTVYLNITHDGHEYASTSTDVDGSNSSYTFNVSHAALEKLPGDAGQNTTVNVTAWGEGTDGNVTTSATEFATDIEFADDHTVRTIHDAENSSLVSEFETSSDDEDSGWFLGLSNPFSSSSSDVATIEDDIGINGSQTDVHVYSEDEDMTGVFDSQLEDADDGERVGMLMTSSVGDGIVYVFASEPGQKIGGENVSESDTYIVANEGGEYMVNMGDNYDGQDTASLSLTAGEKFDRSALQSDLDYSWGQAWGLSVGSFSLPDWIPGVGMIVPASGSLAMLIPAGRRRLFA